MNALQLTKLVLALLTFGAPCTWHGHGMRAFCVRATCTWYACILRAHAHARARASISHVLIAVSRRLQCTGHEQNARTDNTTVAIQLGGVESNDH